MQKSKHYFFSKALIQRIQEDDFESSLFHEEYYRMEAGLSGEERVKQVLEDYSFKSEHFIFYNFECKNDRGFNHQIDALIVTPYFIVILEVKQIAGTLFYKPSLHEFYRITENDVRENFPNPFDQVYRHKLFIEQFLTKAGVQMPIFQLVVIANYRAQIDSSLQEMPILHSGGLPYYMENLFNNYKDFFVSVSDIRSIVESIYKPLPARKSIEAHRLKKGVLCKVCNYRFRMTYLRGTWTCEACKTKSRDALQETLHHYRILISPRISNQAFRNFVGIESKFIASKILSRLGLEQYGAKRGRYYIIPEDIYDDEG